MKLKTLLSILLIASFTLVLPITQSPSSLTLIQNTPKSVAISLKTPTVEITIDHSFPVFLNVSFVDLKLNVSKLVTPEGFVFTAETEIQLNHGPGYYLFELFSSQVSRVVISQNGLFFSSIMIIIGLIAVNAIIIVRDYIWVYEV